MYELTQVTQSGSTTESYSYDPVGNRLSSVGVPLYNYNPSNELTSNSTGSYTYDANGNTLSDAQGRGFTWDFENRLTQVVNPGVGTTTFKYVPFGRRIYKQSPNFTSIFVYDGVNLIESTNASGTEVASYTQTRKIDETLAEVGGGTTDYYQADGLGSVTSLSASSGTLANTYVYDSFGNLTNSTGTLRNPFQYTGREFDAETGIYEYRARYFDSSIGRFISEDPIGFKGGIDFYAYVKNRPTRFVDPTGTCPPTEPCAPPPFFDSVSAYLVTCPCNYRGDTEKICRCLAVPFDADNTDPDFMKKCEGCYGGQKSPRAACQCACALNPWIKEAKCNKLCKQLPDK